MLHQPPRCRVARIKPSEEEDRRDGHVQHMLVFIVTGHVVEARVLLPLMNTRTNLAS